MGLADVFPADRYPFPDEDVLARWIEVLADPGVTVEVAEDAEDAGDAGDAGDAQDAQDAGVGGALVAFAAYDAGVLRHLAVRPDHWGTGLARVGVERAVTAIAGGGDRTARLWCLEANDRATGLYEHLGWAPTGRTQPALWPPHPTERELAVEVASVTG